MEENTETKKPQEGEWDNMIPSGERKPKVEFIMKESVELTFADDFAKPNEYTSKDGQGVYYLFNCMQDGEEKVFLTSAWSLLQGLRNATPLAGKTLLITKDMKDGKQHYSVGEVEGDEEAQVVKPGEDDSDKPEESDKVEDDKDEAEATPEVPEEEIDEIVKEDAD